MQEFTVPISVTGNVLIAGIGGGFDVFAGIPIITALNGCEFTLSNLSFSRDYLFRRSTSVGQQKRIILKDFWIIKTSIP